MSANNAVTVLRSPSLAAYGCSADIATFGVLTDEAAGLVAFLAGSAVPQSPQKPLFGGFSALQFGQLLADGAPQSLQNFLPAGLSLPHFVQRIGSPVGHAIRNLIYHPRAGATSASKG